MKQAFALGITLVAFTGCGTSVPMNLHDFADRVQTEWQALKIVLEGGRSPLVRKGTSSNRLSNRLSNPSSQPSSLSSSLSSADPVQSARNAELMQEMFKVVFQKNFANPADFADYVDTLNQGASLEGLYNGFARSSRYRDLEKASGPARVRTVWAFAEELARLESRLPAPTVFSAADTGPLPYAVEPGIPVEAPSPTESVDAPADAPPGAMALAPARSAQFFAGSSVFTLKRLLGEEALKVIETMKDQPEALARWYGEWVVALASRKVDFGLQLRNRPDRAFHEEWAKHASPDHLRWEVLNRLHRVLNETERAEESKK